MRGRNLISGTMRHNTGNIGEKYFGKLFHFMSHNMDFRKKYFQVYALNAVLNER